MMRIAYNLLLYLALPFLPLRLWWRGRREPGYRQDVAQRFGFNSRRPDRPVIWLHAVSLGETRAAQPLVNALRERYPDHALLITHMTATGREAATQLYGGFAQLAFLPYDFPWAMRRFVRHFRPRLAILMETELWPNLLHVCAAEGVPVVLANARLSERSARGYARFGAFARTAFGSLAAIAAQSDADAQRLRALGARNVQVSGNLKFDVAPPAGAAQRAEEFRAWFGARPVFLCASTREGEEALLLDALARSPLDGVLTVIVPRHPQRFDEVAQLMSRRGLPFVRRSEGRAVPAACTYVLGDSMGELAAYYSASDVAYIGGSLLPLGGQNLIEACALGVPVLLGPSTFNFAQAVELALEAGAARQVADVIQLVDEARWLLADPSAREAMSAAGLAFTAAHRGATARTMAVVADVYQR